MSTPTIPDSHRALLDAPIATLATLDATDRPQQTVVWFLADGDTVRISLNTARQKVRNLRRNPAVGLMIVDPENPMRYLELRGDAEIDVDPDYEFATKVGAKYGADLRSFDAPGDSRIVVTIHPSRVNAIDLGA